MDDKPMRSAVIIASAGRRELLAQAMGYVDGLQGAVEKVVSVPDVDSLPAGGSGVDGGWVVVTGARGLAAQRNAALERLDDDVVVFFFDDDAVVRSDYVANALEFFAAHPEVVGLTGRVLLDGAVSGEISFKAAESAITRSILDGRRPAWARVRELYGCNFAFRRAAAPYLRFDARLPLYSWLEDHDFARRLMRFGVLAKVEDCVIVHRAAASGGRQAHERLGYSQVMNPFYLWRKGSFPLWLMAWEMGKRVVKNVAKSIVGGEARWRRRRVQGNAMAWADIVRGRITPERIVDL